MAMLYWKPHYNEACYNEVDMYSIIIYCRFENIRENLIFTNIHELVAS